MAMAKLPIAERWFAKRSLEGDMTWIWEPPLPVNVVHAGHEPSFGCARLVELADAYPTSLDHAG